MDMLSLMFEQLNNGNTLNRLGQSVGAKPAQVRQLAQLGMPVLLQAMSRNANSSRGASALATALDQHSEDAVHDIGGFLSNVDTADGAKILQHVLSGNAGRVQNNLSKQTGLDSSQVMGLLTQLAPLLLGSLGQEKKQQGLDASGLGSLLGAALGQTSNSSGLLNLATQLLDTDHDGSIMDEVGELLGGLAAGSKKKRR